MKDAVRSVNFTATRARSWLRQRVAELGRLPVLVGRVVPAVRRAKSAQTAPFLAWLEQHARSRPDALFCELDQEQYTYAEARTRVRRLASVLVDQGLQVGEVVALVGGNSPTYLLLVLAIAQAGGVAALIHPELRGEPLAHALAAVSPRLTLVEQTGAEAVAEFGPSQCAGRVLEYCAGELEQLELSAAELEQARADPQGDFVLIFTSGTTGMPKPCRVRHDRARSAATLFGSVAFEFRAGDKLYCALPLHHSSALLIGVGAALVAGIPIALRRKFSAREFASDLVRYGATATLYVGDVCRALVHTPRSSAEASLRLRVCVGNGLDASLWREFSRRFGQPQIREFYASTEAPSAILNLTGTVGSLGHVPFERRRGFRLAALDDERGQLARDARGRARECAPNEPGELLLRVFPDARHPLGAFGGYVERAASQARIARDVFESGDAYFRSGDLLRRDATGDFFFVDRLGDGFRWKGENVSALEAERILNAALGFPGVTVFGVSVPGYPGRAGCAEVVTSGPFDAERFAQAASLLLNHARPCFVRPIAALDLTSSLKTRKHVLELARLRLAETLWVRQLGGYVVLTDKLWDDLLRGEARL